MTPQIPKIPNSLPALEGADPQHPAPIPEVRIQEKTLSPKTKTLLRQFLEDLEKEKYLHRKLGGSVFGRESICLPFKEVFFGELTLIDMNQDGKFTVGVDKILGKDGKSLNYQSPQVRQVLKDLKIASFSQLKSLNAAALFLAQVRGITERIERGYVAGNESYLSDLQGFAREAGIPFGKADETQMRELFKKANAKGLDALRDRIRDAADKEDTLEMFREVENMRLFAVDSGMPMLDADILVAATLDEIRDELLKDGEALVISNRFTDAQVALDFAKRCADESGHPIDALRAEKILLPVYFEKIWSAAARGDVRFTEWLIDGLRKEATGYGIDPLSYEYRFPPAISTACKNAVENAFKEAEMELASSAPRLAVILDSLRDAEKLSIKGGIKFDEGRANKIGGKAWISKSKGHSKNAFYELGSMSLSIATGDFSGISRSTADIAGEMVMSHLTFGKGVMTLLGF